MTGQTELTTVFTEITNNTQMSKLFDELFTTSELSNLSLRWQLLKQLDQGISQREIAKNFGISLCKITRGSKLLKEKKSIIKKILEKRRKQNERTS